MVEKRKGDSHDNKKPDNDEKKKRRRNNPRSQGIDHDDEVRSRGRKPTKKYNPSAGMNTTPSPPVEYNQGTESVFSASDLAPVTPQKPRRGRPRKRGGEGQAGTRGDENRRREREPQPLAQLPPPSSTPSGPSHSNYNPIGGPSYGGEGSQSGMQPFQGHGFEAELHHNLFPIVNPLRQPDRNIASFDNYFSFPANFGGMVPHGGAAMQNERGEGGSGMHLRLDAFELGSQYSPTSIDQRSNSPSSQWSSDTLNGVASITPEERHFPPTPYFFDTMAAPHWPAHSPDSQGTFMSGVDLEEPGMVGHPGLVIGHFSSSQAFASSSNQTMGPSHGSSHQLSQNHESHPMPHEMHEHIPYTDCNCPACQHFRATWGSS
ncbi:hypothetical protein Agabi119p4_4223 [Agaricus bisporus var. burnettii]|uniref:Uncharacterized protein n=1 Tax=Agaricus bisporus var. burnettii TaxID=192524 RepID=A0A8H7KH44_AGABI|nr:hypothetical protein Agabi119p4_4223 [Agaricus bisporus var. burnettii]